MSISKPKLTIKIAAAALLSLLMAGAIYGTMRWAVGRADQAAVARQTALIDLVVGQMEGAIAHDQESSTVWDEAVRRVAADDHDWIDANLGRWMHTYFGHDGAFILGPDERLIYGFSVDNSDGGAAYRALAPASETIVAKLRARLARDDRQGLSDRSLSIGETDIVRTNGRPAIISAKPIVSDTGEIKVDPQHQFIHLAVRYLDRDFVTTVSSEYLFGNMRFSFVRSVTEGREDYPLHSRSGQLIGYLSWEPFQPGASVLRSTQPVVAGAGMIVLAVLCGLVIALQRRSNRLKESQGRLIHLAHHDVLSGLPNRGAFNSAVEEALSKSRVAVLFLDLDKFKQVNDSLGHPIGDKLIIQVSSRLKALAAGKATVARIGGDEFTMLLRETSQDAIERLATDIVNSIRQPFEIEGQPILIGISIGIAFSDGGSSDTQDVLRRADIALYHAKNAGRNQFAIFGEHMDEMIRTRRDLEQDLRIALETGSQLNVHYQPIYSADGARLVSVEALARWIHPTRGLIPPNVFVAIAEETGLIEQLGSLVLSKALEDAGRWPDIDVAVNVSAIELRSETFALRTINALEKASINPHRLEMEITESAVLGNEETCQRNIEALRALGIRFALDDFGTGFSSFGRLQQLRIDRIKIDRCFVEGYQSSADSKAIVSAIIGIARAGGLKTTAEGIETGDQQAWLKAAGCDDLQGYLLSRPVPAAEIDALAGTRERVSGGR
jgi:diguanylate cyclase (GGDEF)-like protein